MEQNRPEISLSISSQSMYLHLANDLVEMSVDSAKDLLAEIAQNVEALEKRKAPPAPTDFMWEETVFAEVCEPNGVGADGALLAIGGHEFFIKEAVELRDWINRVLKFYDVEK